MDGTDGMPTAPEDGPAKTPELTAVVAVAVGSADSGGIEALLEILRPLPADFPACILVVMRQGADWDVRLRLVDLLAARIALTVSEARSGDRLAAGTVFVAPPDYHLLVTPFGVLWLSVEQKVNESCPAADPLFKSAAQVYKDRAIGVVLTGADGDGTAGIKAIKLAGGSTISQDENTRVNPQMPHSAIATGRVDLVLPLDRIAGALLPMAAPRR